MHAPLLHLLVCIRVNFLFYQNFNHLCYDHRSVSSTKSTIQCPLDGFYGCPFEVDQNYALGGIEANHSLRSQSEQKHFLYELYFLFIYVLSTNEQMLKKSLLCLTLDILYVGLILFVLTCKIFESIKE